MKYLTSDWHIGESSTPNTHSYLRPRPTAVMVEWWLSQCRAILNPDDTLIFLGDVGVTLDDLDVCNRLPQCTKMLVLGDKEYSGKYFDKADFLALNQTHGIFHSVVDSVVVEVAGREYFLSHKPLDCLGQSRPALCGHVHGIWRSALMPNGQPIINVGIDAWGGLVSEEFVEHQYIALTKHYDENAFPAKWHVVK